MRCWALVIVVATASCAKRAPDIGATSEIHDGELAARVAGPVNVWGGEGRLVTIENIGKKPFDTELGDCKLTAVAPGERRACGTRFGGDPKDVHLALSTAPITNLGLSETNLHSSGPGRYDFTAVVKNDSWSPRAVRVSFVAVSESGHIVGGHSDVEPLQNILAPGQESIVRIPIIVTKETMAGAPLTVREGVAKGHAAIRGPDLGLATLTNVHWQQRVGALAQVVGTLTNVSKRPIYASARGYSRRANRTIGGTTCRDAARIEANVPLAPGESITCIASDPLPEQGSIVAEGGTYTFDVATLTPIAVADVRVENGIVRATLRNTTAAPIVRAIVYTRAQPEWLAVETVKKPLAPGETVAFETPIGKIDSAEVTAFSVVGGARAAE